MPLRDCFVFSIRINALIGRHMPNCSDPSTGEPYACWALAEAHHNKSNPAPPACCTEWSGDWDPTQAAALLRYTYSQVPPEPSP